MMAKPIDRNKQAVHMVLDTTIVEYFKQQAGNQDYQNLMADRPSPPQLPQSRSPVTLTADRSSYLI
jgi:hypothetical protein